MELVTLAHVALNRVGSASRAGMMARTKVKVVREAPDASAEGLAVLVASIAVEHGEQPETLLQFQHRREWSRAGQCEAHVFDVQGPNVHYSTPYAECWAFPALKIGDRYFKLDEVKRNTA